MIALIILCCLLAILCILIILFPVLEKRSAKIELEDKIRERSVKSKLDSEIKKNYTYKVTHKKHVHSKEKEPERCSFCGSESHTLGGCGAFIAATCCG